VGRNKQGDAVGIYGIRNKREGVEASRLLVGKLLKTKVTREGQRETFSTSGPIKGGKKGER